MRMEPAAANTSSNEKQGCYLDVSREPGQRTCCVCAAYKNAAMQREAPI